MHGKKQQIEAIQNELIGILQDKEGGSVATRITAIKDRLPDIVEAAKEQDDGITQLYVCLVDACLETFEGSRDELIEKITSLTQPDMHFILTREKGVTYPPNTQMLDADTYGFYYAVNDHFSKLWDPKQYRLSKNGAYGNPLITQLLKACYFNNEGAPVYVIDREGYEQRNPHSPHDNDFRAAIFHAFEKYDTHIFGDIKMAYVGGAGKGYQNVVLQLAQQFDKQFIHFTGLTMHLSLRTAELACSNNYAPVDYVVSSNVLNAFDHHLDVNRRDEVMAASAKLLKKGGKAIHLMEKLTEQTHLNANLNRSLHNAIGQDLVYSFFREKGAMDLDFDAKNAEFQKLSAQDPFHPVRDSHGRLGTVTDALKDLDAMKLDGKGDDFATSMLVLHQARTPDITQESLAKTAKTLGRYTHRFNYYNKPVYVERPGEQSRGV